MEENFNTIHERNGKDVLKDQIKLFKKKYIPYRDIKRFSIPVIGCISSGKSTILNYLLKLKKTLEMRNQITTKCICIIRHQKGLKKPKIYEVELKPRDFGVFNFEKGKEILENVGEVISERNRLITNDKIGNDYEKYFLIIEYEIPFFLGEMEKYADLFEFMDVPGLNESVDSKTKKGDNKDISIADNFYFQQIFPLIKNNIKFSLFIFSQDNYSNRNTTEILLAYVNQKKKEKKIEKNNDDSKTNFGEMKFQEINEIREQEKKEIKDNSCASSFKDSIFILNKMDKIPEEERERKKKNFANWIKGEFEDELKKKFANENLNEREIKLKLDNYKIHLDNSNLIGIMGKKLNEESSKIDSFKDYLEFYISNSNTYKINSKIFSDYIEERMSEDFNINFDIESEEEDEGKGKKLAKLSEKDLEIYNRFSELINKDSKFNKFLSEKEYIKYKKLFKKNKKNFIKPKGGNELEKLIEEKIKNIIKDYFNIDTYLSMQQVIQKDFNIKPGDDKKILIKKKLKENINNSEGIYDPKGFINDFREHIIRIDKLGGNKNKTIGNIKTNHELMKNYLENSSSIRFLLIGPHNAGKSTLLNQIIGYNRKLLESSNEECTKISVIVRYAKKKEKTKLFSADFHTNKLGYNYFKENQLLAEGDDKIIKKIKQLNRENATKQAELKFFILSTPIEIFDRIIEENKTSEVKIDKIEEIIGKIEILDFPGLDTKFEEAKKKAENLLKIVDGFIYVNYSINFESANRDILGLIYNSIKDRLNFSFNNCLFILNKMDEEENKEINLEEATQMILKIFDEQNDYADSITVLDRKQRIQDKALSLSPFSCYRYISFKNFESDIQNFEKFIKYNMGNNVKKKIKILMQTLEGYIDDIDLREISLSNEIIYEYINRLNNLLTDINDKSEKDLTKIVKLYFYIKNNIRKVKVYQLCYIEPLIRNFKIVIKKTSDFFAIKLRNDALSFITKSYEEILDFYYIIKLRMSDENIDKFKKLDKNEILSKIEEEYNDTEKKIKNFFERYKNLIYEEINNCSNESGFTRMVENHKYRLENLKDLVQTESANFKDRLRRENAEIIRKLNLQELEGKKKDFQNQMNKIKALTISDSVDSSSSAYIQSHMHTYSYTESYKERFLLFFKRTKYRTVYKTERVYEHGNTIKKYKEEISNFFKNAKENSIENIYNNRKRTVNNIENIFSKFNESVDSFQNNIDTLKEYIDDIERFIYEQTGIKG